MQGKCDVGARIALGGGFPKPRLRGLVVASSAVVLAEAVWGVGVACFGEGLRQVVGVLWRLAGDGGGDAVAAEFREGLAAGRVARGGGGGASVQVSRAAVRATAVCSNGGSAADCSQGAASRASARAAMRRGMAFPYGGTGGDSVAIPGKRRRGGRIIRASFLREFRYVRHCGHCGQILCKPGAV